MKKRNNFSIVKKSNILILFILLFANTFCNKVGLNLQTVNTRNYEILLSRVKNESNSQLQKLYYATFTNEEKLKFWKDHFLIAISKKNYISNPDKIDLITELNNNLKKEIFDLNSDARNIFLTYIIPTWLKKSENIFSKEEVSELLLYNYQVNSIEVLQDSGKIKNNALPDEPSVDCFCHVGNTGYTCKQLSMGFPSGVSIKYGVCEEASNKCKTTTFGCGILWAESCTGSHCNFG